MTTDKTPSELDAFIETHMPAYWQYGAVEQDRLRSLVLAASVKWGSPVVAGEVVATVIKRGADRQWMSERLGSLPDGIYSLYLNPQPTQTQVGAVPLTPEQRTAAFIRAEKKMQSDVNLSWRHALADEIEAAHGIKGDQHADQ